MQIIGQIFDADGLSNLRHLLHLFRRGHTPMTTKFGVKILKQHRIKPHFDILDRSSMTH